MGNIEFAWDPRKAKSNLAKHGISFEEARTAFFDDSARVLADPDHSGQEDRFILLGYSSRCLVVSHCYRENDSRIRIIPARPATGPEERSYWSFT